MQTRHGVEVEAGCGGITTCRQDTVYRHRQGVEVEAGMEGYYKNQMGHYVKVKAVCGYGVEA